MKRHYSNEGEPLSCPRCNSIMLGREVKATDAGVVSEYSVRCGRCNAVVGYFAYGHWDPAVILHWARYHVRPGRVRRAWKGLKQALRSLARNIRGRL